MDLPPGFRFHPTDEEIITHYLTEKINNKNFCTVSVAEVDLNQCEPWDLPGKAKMGEKEWYFFFRRDKKYPTGRRTNRATKEGYWKATGKDKEILKAGKGCVIGMKKTLVFYTGRAPKGEKTNWVMHEYRHEENLDELSEHSKDDSWVVCRVFHKNTGMKKPSEERHFEKDITKKDYKYPKPESQTQNIRYFYPNDASANLSFSTYNVPISSVENSQHCKKRPNCFEDTHNLCFDSENLGFPSELAKQFLLTNESGITFFDDNGFGTEMNETISAVSNPDMESNITCYDHEGTSANPTEDIEYYWNY